MERKSSGRSGLVYHPHALLLFLLFLALPHPTKAGSSRRSTSNSADEDRVGTLPGQGFNVSFAHYSGYVTVNQDSGRAIFYWFFEASEDPASKPLVLWLQGGPGCSSIGCGMAVEVGPFHIKPDGKTLYLNNYSWNQAANLLFIDSPVGAGYSYSNNSLDIQWNGDARAAQDALVFLLEWMKKFPEYQGRDFYITGESYAGHYIPQLAQAIVWSQRWLPIKIINLKGFMVGNPLTDDFYDYLGVFEFKWTTGLISDDTYHLLNFFCQYDSFLKPSPACKKILDISEKELGGIDIYSIYTPACTENRTTSNGPLKGLHLSVHCKIFLYTKIHPPNGPFFLGIEICETEYSRRSFSAFCFDRDLQERFGEPYDPCYLNHSAIYFNTPEVQKALHVDPQVLSDKWQPCNRVIFNNWKDTAKSMLNVYRELMLSGLRIWVYSGDTDTVIPVASTRYWIESLKLPTVIPWQAWYEDGQVGGWAQEYKGLTYATVRGAGHLVPLHRPKLAVTIFKAFLSGTPLWTSPEISESQAELI